MGVRIEGDLDFHRWYYEKYNDISLIVSHEIYREYLDYKAEQRKEFKKICISLFYIILGVNLLFLEYKLLIVFHLMG